MGSKTLDLRIQGLETWGLAVWWIGGLMFATGLTAWFLQGLFEFIGLVLAGLGTWFFALGCIITLNLVPILQTLAGRGENDETPEPEGE